MLPDEAGQATKGEYDDGQPEGPVVLLGSGPGGSEGECMGKARQKEDVHLRVAEVPEQVLIRHGISGQGYVPGRQGAVGK